MNFRLDYIPTVGPVLFEGSTKAYHFGAADNAAVATDLGLLETDVKNVSEMIGAGQPWNGYSNQ